MLKNTFLLLIFGCIANMAMAAQCHNTDNVDYFKRHSLKTTTAQTIVCDYQNERKMYDGEIGLALSGGGTRAALFAHGIIQGLHNNGLLDKVSIISSVSGGGYAANWLITNSYLAQKEGFNQQAIFEDCVPVWATKPGSDDRRMLDNVRGMPRCYNNNYLLYKNPAYLVLYRWQANIATHPDLFRKTPANVTGNRQNKNWLKLAELIGRGVYDVSILSRASGGMTARMYEEGILRVWGPLPDSAKMTLNLSWSNLKTGYREGYKIPFWILNSRYDQKSSSQVDEERIYEITPDAHGSEELGYTTRPFAFAYISTAVRLSGAFVDYQGLTAKNLAGRVMKAIRTISSTSWGENVPVPDAHIIKTVRLSDGGGEENLGVISLIRRGIKNIIVVDGSYDRSGTMDDLCRVRQILEKNAMKITFASLPDLPEVCSGRKVYNTSRWLNKVLVGDVTWDSKQHQPLTIFYFKLGWNEPYFQRQLNAYHQNNIASADPGAAFLTFFYFNNVSVRNPKDHNMYFPQISTAGLTLNSSSYLFWGYRELGRYMAKELDATAIYNPKSIKECVQRPVSLSLQGKKAEQTPESGNDRMFNACVNGENIRLSEIHM